MVTPIPTPPSRPPSIAVAPCGVPTVEGRNDCQVGANVWPKLWITAYDGEDPLKYAEAAAEMGREGNTGDYETAFSTFLTI